MIVGKVIHLSRDRCHQPHTYKVGRMAFHQENHFHPLSLLQYFSEETMKTLVTTVTKRLENEAI